MNMKKAKEISKIWQRDAWEIAQAVREKKITCQQVISDHLQRIETMNKKVNAITVVLADQALATANKTDLRIERGEVVGPLAGVPFTVKENIDLVGSATTFGIIPMKNAMPAIDAPHIAQLKLAGAIPIGRTNLSEMGLRPHTANQLRGATLNPWNPDITPGGSSGGDAVAVATGMVPLGMGNDYGGSLRAPAQFCGVCSIKPSLGRVPDHMSLMPSEPAISSQLFLFQGPLARRIRDLRLALQCMSGFDARDPRWIPAPLKGCISPHPIRVAVTFDPGGGGVSSQVAANIKLAADWLSDAGYAVEEVEPPSIIEAWQTWVELTSMEIKHLVLPGISEVATPEGLKFLQFWSELFPGGDLHSYMSALARRNAIIRKWLQFQEKYQLVLGPSLTQTDFVPDFDIQNIKETRRFIQASRLLMAGNMLGLPAIVLPVDLSESFPGAIQIIGPRFREDMVFDAAEAIEQRSGIFTPINRNISATNHCSGQAVEGTIKRIQPDV
jgi:amidase